MTLSHGADVQCEAMETEQRGSTGLKKRKRQAQQGEQSISGRPEMAGRAQTDLCGRASAGPAAESSPRPAA